MTDTVTAKDRKRLTEELGVQSFEVFLSRFLNMDPSLGLDFEAVKRNILGGAIVDAYFRNVHRHVRSYENEDISRSHIRAFLGKGIWGKQAVSGKSTGKLGFVLDRSYVTSNNSICKSNVINDIWLRLGRMALAEHKIKPNLMGLFTERAMRRAEELIPDRGDKLTPQDWLTNSLMRCSRFSEDERDQFLEHLRPHLESYVPLSSTQATIAEADEDEED